jgi:hypothetical protein
MNEIAKKEVTQADFNKQIEIEVQNYMYFDRMSEVKALEKAKKYVDSKYQVI